MDDVSPSYNTEVVNSIYNTELVEHLNDLKQLKTQLSEVRNIFRQGTGDLNEEEKQDKINDMKEYIEQALASIAYTTTHATQKVRIDMRKH